MSGTYASDAYGAAPLLLQSDIPPEQLAARIIPSNLAIPARFDQAISANLDYSIDWLITPDVISQSSWECATADLTRPSHAGLRTTVFLSGTVAGQWHTLINTITTTGGRRDSRTIMVFTIPALAARHSGLFPNGLEAVAAIRRDRLVNLARSHLAGIEMSDDAIWGKIVAAEGEAERTLRVWISPREVLPSHPSYDAQAAALVAAGQRVEREPGYDYEPGLFNGNRWGLIEMRQRPISAVHWIKFAYPTPDANIAEIPASWIRPEGTTNKVNLVPNTSPFAAPLNAFILSALGGGSRIPFMLQIAYRAGLEDARARLPDLPTLVQRMACLSLIDDLLLAQSGSVSADGLSQSISFEAEKHRETIEAKLGKMRDALQGPRLIVA